MALSTRFALPDDPALDAFSSGVIEVDAWFRSRRWFHPDKGKSAPPTYQFLVEPDGELVGYASIAFRKIDHPHDGATTRERYLVIYAAGVRESFQGRLNPKTNQETYAVSMFRVIEGFARNAERCVGLSLWVRTDNPRAMAFYRKMGFVPDPGGPLKRDGGAPHLSMRKPL